MKRERRAIVPQLPDPSDGDIEFKSRRGHPGAAGEVERRQDSSTGGSSGASSSGSAPALRCAYCRDWFLPVRRHQRFCKDGHRIAAWRAGRADFLRRVLAEREREAVG